MIHKKYLLILVVLLAVIGLVGAGCLGSDNDDNVTNGTNNETGFATDVNSTNTSDTSNNTSNNSNTSGASNNSGLPDVVYANQGSGGGGSGRGSSTPVPTETTAKFGSQSLVVEEYVEYIEGEGDEEDQTVYLVYVYVPTSDMETGDTLSVTFLQSVTGAIEMDGEDVIEDIEDGVLFSDIQVKGKVVTTTLKQEEIDFGEWNDFNLGVLIGDDVYLVSFYASTIWNFDLPAGASARIVEIGDEDYTELTVTGKKTVVTDSKVTDVQITITPPSGKVISSITTNPELDTTDETPVLLENSLRIKYSDVASSIYDVTASFETSTKAVFSGQNLQVSQYPGDPYRVMVFVSALDVINEDLKLTFTETIDGISDVNPDLIDGTPVPSGNSNKEVILSINNTAEIDDFSSWFGGGTKSLTVETADGRTYNIWIVAVIYLNFNIESNGKLEWTDGYDTVLIEGSDSQISGVGSHTLTAIPADGYVVDTFKINGETKTSPYTGDFDSTYIIELTFKEDDG